jgi:hypothetical protein
MDDKIIATFCLCDDLLKAMHHQEDHQGQMNDAEIMTTALVASLFFRGNHESARAMLQQHSYIPHMVSKSRFSRRLHRIKDIFIIFFNILGQTWKTLNTDAIYVIDSIPIAVCDHIRIRRAKIYSHEDFRGYQASKKRYFYGLFTTGHFFQRLNCNIESHRNRGVFTQQVIKQSQSELEQTEITAVAPMDNTDPTVWLTQRTEIDDPDVG